VQSVRWSAFGAQQPVVVPALANGARFSLQRIGLAVFAVLAISGASPPGSASERDERPASNGSGFRARAQVIRMPRDRAGHFQTCTGRFRTPLHAALVRNQQTAIEAVRPEGAI
jgi:hypothetical protein